MGMFARQIAEAKPTEGTGLFFLPGQYPVVQVKQLKLKKSEDPKKANAELFIIVADILESHVASRPAGTQDVAQILNSNHVGAKDDAKRFILALFPGTDENTINEEGVNALTSVEQPCAGMLLSLECYEKVNDKNPNKKFTKHIWRPVDPATAARAVELRAKAGLPPLQARS